MSTPTLTPTQSLILTTAIQNHQGQLAWFPENIKGGARKQVIEGLAKRELISTEGDAWRVTAAGYEALSMTPPAHDEVETEAPISTEAKPRRSRENTKQAAVIALLKRPEGATLAQLVAATQWQKHTVRGALSLLGKKQGLRIASEKTEAGRVYRAA